MTIIFVSFDIYLRRSIPRDGIGAEKRKLINSFEHMKWNGQNRMRFQTCIESNFQKSYNR